MKRRSFIKALLATGATATVTVAQAFAPENTVEPAMLAIGRRSLSLKQFGAKGDGITDDTAAIQSALASGARNLTAGSGLTFLIDGGLSSDTPGLTIDATGAIFKLKRNASHLGMLTISGVASRVTGGSWDGNKTEGNRTGDPYNSFNILMAADGCVVSGIKSVNTYGMAIKGGGKVSGCVAENNVISDIELYGIFIDSAGVVDQIGNRAIGNVIDCSAGREMGQGILFTSLSASVHRQIGWDVSSNRIIGYSRATTAQAICIGVRGNRGRFADNITKYGSMGISEGGDNTLFINNTISDVSGAGYGIEPSGKGCIVAGNQIRNAKYGIICSGEKLRFDDLKILNNLVEVSEACVLLQIGALGSGENISIAGNSLVTGRVGVLTTRRVAGLVISRNEIVGPGSKVPHSRGVFLQEPSAAANVAVMKNKLSGFERAMSVYSAATSTISDLNATGNDLSQDVAAVKSGWTVEGAATLGQRISFD